MARVYLDYNATAPLRAEAKAAMMQAMEVVGNPSSVHAEGRAAKAIIEKARAQVAAAFGAQPHDIVFTSGATEAAALALGTGWTRILTSPVEHDCILSHRADNWQFLPLDFQGFVNLPDMRAASSGIGGLVIVQAANSETGIVQPWFDGAAAASESGAMYLMDAVQAAGKEPLAINWQPPQFTLFSAHKLGGPKGIGALVLPEGFDLKAMIKGGGQEMGRRSGTENIIGIAGFGAAAEAAARDLADGVWGKVEKLRNILENAIADRADQTIFVGKDAPRLPNTSCILTPGWKGETQVMQMDLAGFAISAGSACSSGKVKASKVLLAMGFDETAAASAIRVSLGPETTEDEVLAFADAWLAQYEKFRARAA